MGRVRLECVSDSSHFSRFYPPSIRTMNLPSRKSATPRARREDGWSVRATMRTSGRMPRHSLPCLLVGLLRAHDILEGEQRPPSKLFEPRPLVGRQAPINVLVGAVRGHNNHRVNGWSSAGSRRRYRHTSSTGPPSTGSRAGRTRERALQRKHFQRRLLKLVSAGSTGTPGPRISSTSACVISSRRFFMFLAVRQVVYR